MAYIGNNYIDAAKRPTTSSSPNARATLGAGGGTAGSGGVGAGGGQATQPGGNAPGSFTNLSSYLQANQDSGAATGQGAANVVNQAYNTNMVDQGTYDKSASAAIGQGTGVDQGVLSQIDAGTAKVDDRVLNDIETSGRGGPYLPVPWQDSAAYKGPDYDSIDVAYGGPNSTSELTGQAGIDRGKMNQSSDLLAGKDANLQGGFNGITSLLGDAFNAPNYSRGEKNLDTFLARGSAGGAAALKEAQPLAAQAMTNASQMETGLGQKIQGAKDQVGATNDAYRNAVNQGMQTSSNTFDRYAQAEKDRMAKGNATQDAQNAASFERDPIHIDNTRVGTLQVEPPDQNPYIPANRMTPGMDIQDDGYNQWQDPYGLPKSFTQGGGAAPGSITGDYANMYKNYGPDDYSTKNPWNPLPMAHGGEVPSYGRLNKMLGCGGRK